MPPKRGIARPVDDGLSYWVGQLNAGKSHQQVASMIQDSQEYRNLEVQGLFTALLHRHD